VRSLRSPSALAVFTKSAYRERVSPWLLDVTGSRINGMDVVSIILGLIGFALLLALVYGIERI
jgi:hypothetical protein